MAWPYVQCNILDGPRWIEFGMFDVNVHNEEDRQMESFSFSVAQSNQLVYFELVASIILIVWSTCMYR